ncbi:hypothetical protein ALO77_05075, partial [Pseudomonas coronafaciens pv. garcae]
MHRSDDGRRVGTGHRPDCGHHDPARSGLWTGSRAGRQTLIRSSDVMALLKRLVERDRPALSFTLDGQPASGLFGDTLLTAILTTSEHLRGSDFS